MRGANIFDVGSKVASIVKSWLQRVELYIFGGARRQFSVAAQQFQAHPSRCCGSECSRDVHNVDRKKSASPKSRNKFARCFCLTEIAMFSRNLSCAAIIFVQNHLGLWLFAIVFAERCDLKISRRPSSCIHARWAHDDHKYISLLRQRAAISKSHNTFLSGRAAIGRTIFRLFMFSPALPFYCEYMLRPERASHARLSIRQKLVWFFCLWHGGRRRCRWKLWPGWIAN